jgi:hypothetical protein
MAWSATRTERNQQACHKGEDPGSRMPFRGRSGDIHEGISFVFQEKSGRFPAPEQTPLF